MKEQVVGKTHITRRNNMHKEFLDQEKKIELSKFPDGSRKINGRMYEPHKDYEKKSDAITESKSLNSQYLTHIGKTNGKWMIYKFKI
jgi:hypothetical protein